MASVDRRTFLSGAAAVAVAGAVLPGSAEASDAGGGGRGAPATPPAFSLRNARILLGDGTEVQGGLRVEDGRIVALGPAVTEGTDLGGEVLWPGLTLAGAPLGLFEIGLESATHDQGEDSDGVLPQVRALDGYNPRSAVVGVARAAGIQQALVIPGGGMVSGQAAWVRLVGETRSEAVLVEEAGACVHVGGSGKGGLPGQGHSRMGVLANLRALLEQNRKDCEDPVVPLEGPLPPSRGTSGVTRRGLGRWFGGEGHAAAPGKDPVTLDPRQRALRALRHRERKALLFAERADDLLAAVDLARAWNLDAVIVGAAEGHLVARALADAGFPLLVGPVTVQPSGWDRLAACYENAARLHAAGVRFALRVGDAHMARDLTTEAGIAVAHGLPFGAAVAAVSGNAPAFWGLDAGVLRVGGPATFVHASGDPLQPRHQARAMWRDGAPVPLVSRQTELYARWK